MQTIHSMQSHLWDLKLYPPYGHYRCGSQGPHLIGNTYLQKGQKYKVIKCSPWTTEVKPFPSYKRRQQNP